MKKAFITILLSTLLSSVSSGQSKIVEDFKPVCDTLCSLIENRCGVEGDLKLDAVMKRGSTLDFYFTESLGDFPWYSSDIKWLRKTLHGLFPKKHGRYRLGEIYSRRVSINELVTPSLTYDGQPSENKYRIRPYSGAGTLVKEADGPKYNKGLSGRHIALWQSHGRYFDQGAEKWQWQRPCLFQTCEDMFTQGFVLPFLVPMLENAGAYVLLPRERDVQTNEIIADNDPAKGGRGVAEYEEKGKWADAGAGFADTKTIYTGLDNPFTEGTAREALCVGPHAKPNAEVKWTPDIPERGEYAVYVSYKTLPSSTTSARYAVTHMGGRSELIVNQKMGGGTWVYLGTFEFDEGKSGFVSLDNGTPKGHRLVVGGKVTADAVRFGGGMGNIARSPVRAPEDSTSIEVEPMVSGLPRFAEGARYYLQWAGTDTTIFHQNQGKHDYRDDFMSRGDWVEWISRGTRMNPDSEGGLGIPIDLSFGFHTDAGVTPNDSLIGTLTIYTYRSERKTELPSSDSRMTSRVYADMVQSQIVSDLRAEYDSLWTRRSIWDRGYRESRTPSSPAMLLELLSHQNFADMKYGLDPSFRFTVSRSVYKGMLKYLSSRYGVEYKVQPLPVSSMSVRFSSSGKAIVSWRPETDPLEPTADPEGYILYTRVGDGGFDTGKVVNDFKRTGELCSCEVDLSAGEVVSFKIAAFNEGGESFPSETVSIGYPSTESRNKVLIVNNFDRVSGPAWFDGERRAGFDNGLDSGVPYMRDITFVGEMHEFRRNKEWISNERPGFGASYSDLAGKIVAGNTFDYASIHGKAILEAGYSFYSCSNESFCADSTLSSEAWTVDLICGKQVSTPLGRQIRYEVFPACMQKALSDYATSGGNILVSGSYIGTDVWDSIYPIEAQSNAAGFVKKILGYRFLTGKASRGDAVVPVKGSLLSGIEGFQIVGKMNPDIYCIESPDGIAPADSKGKTICRYSDSGIAAGVGYQGDGYKAVSFGFPIETIENRDHIKAIISSTLEYFEK